MLRKARIILSVVIFGLITFYFLDFAEILPNSFHRLAHIQFVPALMSLSFIILVVLILITLLSIIHNYVLICYIFLLLFTYIKYFATLYN